MPMAKTDARERAKLRANEERRALHAANTLVELMKHHNLEDRDVSELHAISLRLVGAIRSQHCKDERLERMKERFAPTAGEF